MSYLVQRIARRWVAGDSIPAALSEGERLERRGMHVLYNYLGEHYKSKFMVERSVGTYLLLVDQLTGNGSGLSLKLTELGLDIGKGYCLSNLLKIAQKAKAKKIPIWIDMESMAYTKQTIDLYQDMHRTYRHMGVTLQANVKRTEEDLERLIKRKARIRLVKGAYKGEFKDWEEIEHRYSRFMRLLFSKSEGFAIATNDQALLKEAVTLKIRYSPEMEFQFLRGIRPRLAEKMARRHTVTIYTPFGKHMINYVWRRFREHGLSLIHYT